MWGAKFKRVMFFAIDTSCVWTCFCVGLCYIILQCPNSLWHLMQCITIFMGVGLLTHTHGFNKVCFLSKSMYGTHSHVKLWVHFLMKWIFIFQMWAQFSSPNSFSNSNFSISFWLFSSFKKWTSSKKSGSLHLLSSIIMLCMQNPLKVC